MASLSPRENYLLAMEHKPTEFIPMAMLDTTFLGGMDDFEKGPPGGGGKDGFGVTWVFSNHTGINGPIPEPGNFILKDVTEWKKVVTFPDVDAIGWENKAGTDMAQYDRDMLAVSYVSSNGPFERLAALMGFENALLSMAAEPEAVNDLFTAIVD